MWACRLAAKATVKVKYKLTRRNPPRGRGLLGVASATRVISDPVLDSSSTTGATTGLAESASGVRVAGSGGRGGGGGAGGGEKGSRVHQVAWLGNACAVSADGKYVISCGHWDDSFKVREGTRPPIHPSRPHAHSPPRDRTRTHRRGRATAPSPALRQLALTLRTQRTHVPRDSRSRRWTRASWCALSPCIKMWSRASRWTGTRWRQGRWTPLCGCGRTPAEASPSRANTCCTATTMP